MADLVPLEIAISAKQRDCHSCGYFCLNFIEEDYRLFRGEGAYCLPARFFYKAANLSRFFYCLNQAKARAEKAVAKAKVVHLTAAPVPMADQPPVVDPARPPETLHVAGSV